MTRCPSQDWDVYCRNQDVPEITILRETVIRKARKEFKCVMCAKPIDIGTQYERVVFIDDEGKLKSDAAHSMNAAYAWQGGEE